MVPRSAISYHLWPFFQSLAHRFTTFMATPTSIMPFPLFFATWWDNFCRNTSAWQVELIVTVFVQLIGLWLPATIYQLVEVCGPDFSRHQKHQPDPRQQPTRTHILRCIRYAFFMTLGDIAIQIGLGLGDVKHIPGWDWICYADHQHYYERF